MLKASNVSRNEKSKNKDHIESKLHKRHMFHVKGIVQTAKPAFVVKLNLTRLAEVDCKSL
jgi:hypothetical protein